MLRLREATSSLADFTQGRFEPVLDDARTVEGGGIDAARIERVILHSGKIHYDLTDELSKHPDKRIALVRLEQYFPAPVDAIKRVLARYPNAEPVWVQEEPENQGAWPYVVMEFARNFGAHPIRVVSRPAAASPAAGSAKRHAHQQAELIQRALTF